MSEEVVMKQVTLNNGASIKVPLGDHGSAVFNAGVYVAPNAEILEELERYLSAVMPDMYKVSDFDGTVAPLKQITVGSQHEAMLQGIVTTQGVMQQGSQLDAALLTGTAGDLLTPEVVEQLGVGESIAAQLEAVKAAAPTSAPAATSTKK